MLSNIRIKNGWLGTYVGDGEFEGGSINNTTFRNIDLTNSIKDQIFSKLWNKIKKEENFDITCCDKIEVDYEIVNTHQTGHFSW